ncbi:MAG: FAD-binding protein [Bacteroidales bacterium]|nr:FAD-binding protein [Bacteroidales bacterium]
MTTYKNIHSKLTELKNQFNGDIYLDESTRLLYATDASAYKEIPLAVTRPKNIDDIKKLICLANEHKTSLIPRTAGTSLAGQVVGGGIVVDVSKYMTEIIELNENEHWVRVQPGVVLDELNKFIKPNGLYFGPETSSSNRCMIGGMVGNNSCGAHSLIYGNTRQHVISVKTILSDGLEVEFGPLSISEFKAKCTGNTLENKIYRNINEILSNPENQKEICKQFPDSSIKRRNTGYAIDILLNTEPFTPGTPEFNFSKLIAGSEGTLAFISEIKLNLVTLPHKEKGLVCINFHKLEHAFHGNLIALKYKPYAVELMDDIIIEQTKNHLQHKKNRFIIKDEPKAIIIVEFAKDTKEEILQIAGKMEAEMRDKGYGYHFPIVFNGDIQKVWALRKAGLGLLSNIPGDAKPVAVIEDTTVNPKVLPDFINDLKKLLDRHGLSCVFYAHIDTGELHLRPVLNLKKQNDVELFHLIALETAKLVKKYNGSISGEHGDGRLRGEFIPLMIGEKNYKLLKDIKYTWDPNKIFNPGKIIDTPKMNTFLRYKPGQVYREIETIFDFSKDLGILRSVEKCNGSADCRKSEIIGGTMCPSYMATRDENTTTRARANILREFLTNSDKKNPFDYKEIYDIMDLCLSCKACKSECPSSVDIAKLKAEFLQHYYDANGIPVRTKAIAYINNINKLSSVMPFVNNFFMSNRFFSKIIKKILGFAPKRSIPLLYKITLKNWVKKNLKKLQCFENLENLKGKIYLFADEFTNYNDTEIGIKTIKLLTRLGYYVELPRHTISGRTFLSKGLIRKAKKIANKNVNLLKNIISEEAPLLGIEPSGILTFRDEYPELVDKNLKDDADELAKNTLMIDEFIIKEIEKGKITKEQFTKEALKIKLHGHCQQKSIASTVPTKKMLSLPENYEVEEIPSGCCGMAGSFGYEKEHYELSMKIGELVLFPEIRKTDTKIIIAAAGTSCRHQIKDGTGREALHPIEILYEALIYI